MAVNKYIRGLSGRGFRVKNNAGAWKTVKENPAANTQVDLSAVSTQDILSRERDNFVRVADSSATTAIIQSLHRKGLRLRPAGGTFTVTIASPGVFSKTAHGFIAGDALVFTTTGALPTGLTSGTTYYVISTGLAADTFRVSATLAGSAVNTSGSQSGTHTVSAQRRNVVQGDTITVDLNDGDTKKFLKRNFGRWIAASGTTATIYGISDRQRGFNVGEQGTGLLTTDTVAVTAGKVVVVGTKTYTFRASLTEVKASAVLSSDGTEPADADTVTVNDQVYRFKNTMAQANDVKRSGVSSDADLDNLRAAINGTGTAGVEWFAGTLPATGVTCAARTGTGATGALTVTATTPGTAGNSFAKAETSAHLDWDGVGAVFTGGVDAIANEVLKGANADASLTNLAHAINDDSGEGSLYSTGTAVNADVTAAFSTPILTVTATALGALGTSIPTTTDETHLSWGAATVQGNITGFGRGVSSTVKLTNAKNLGQLRRHFKSWVEG